MKALVLPRYSRMGASSRLRFYQYLPGLESAGIACEVHPLLNDQYLEDFYAGRPTNMRNLLRCYWTIFQRLRGARKYDVILLEKEVFPFLPPLVEWWLNLKKVPFIVDYDDAIFHNYDKHPNKLIRFLFKRKIATVMRRSEVVVCGNPYLADYAHKAGARKIALIPTVIDTQKYLSERAGSLGQPLVIGWIGTPATVKYLWLVKPVLEDIASRYDVCIHIVGTKQGIGLGNLERVLDWSEEAEQGLIGAFDIGIMPLEDSPWERGKCGYKLIQYMGSGIPVVGSPVGVNEEIIDEGVNGFKPHGLENWTLALERLVRDVKLRKDMGQNGRRLVEKRYSLEKGLASWLTELNHLSSIKKD
jgi:glycosyltransferase involved in cell wall biosynthesis